MRVLSAGLIAVGLLVSSVAVANDSIAYRNTGIVVASLKICSEKYLVDQDLADWTRESALAELKEDLDGRYSPNAMKEAYKTAINMVSRMSQRDFLATCQDLSDIFGPMKEAEEAEEMEF